MAVMEIYAIRDDIGGFYEQPFHSHNRAYAERMLCDFSRLQPDHQVVLHHGDYSLYRLGHYDNLQGCIVPLPYPEFINRISAYVTPTQQGAAVGGEVAPLKPQSDPESVDAPPVCDTTPETVTPSTPPSEAKESEV